MKRILFVVPAFTVGGTNTSLISLLPFIDKERYSVFVYAMNPVGPMGQEIAKYSTVINSLLVGVGSTNQPKNFKAMLKDTLKRIKLLMGKLGIDLTSMYYKRQVKSLSSRHFDCVIAFQEGEATRFVQYFTNTRKVAWVRSAYARYLSVTQTQSEESMYDKYNLIVNVSRTAMEGFLQVMPQYRDKSVYVYNLVNKERIISLSKKETEFPQVEGLFTIVSLGRVDKVKHFNEIPGIAKKLKEQGLRFQWLIIGGQTVRYPEEFKTLNRKIEEYGLQGQVIMLGHQPNPYPFLASSNLLVCLSESETFNHTFAEARTLGVPVLSVNYLGAEEFLANNQGGVITTREYICEEIYEIITDKVYYSALKCQAEEYSYDNESQLKMLYNRVF